MISVPNPFDGDITDEEIFSWTNQFSLEDRPFIEKLLSNFQYYSSKKVNSTIKVLHTKIQKALKIPAENIWYVPVGYVAKSGTAVAYFYKIQNNLPQNRFISSNDLPNLQLTKESAVVFLDDFIGSGHQATMVWQKILEPIIPMDLPCPIVFGALVGFEKGIRYLESSTKFEVIVADIISDSNLPFSLQSTIFDNEEEKLKTETIVKKYGEILYPQHPLGYSESKGILGFFYSTPNNTIPIFWSTEKNWQPLLPHGESFRDPNNLIGPPPGLEPSINSENHERPITESIKLENYDISEEMSLKIFGEFHLPRIYLILAPILNSLNIDSENFSLLLNLIKELKYLKHEKEDVCSSILIINDEFNPESIGDIFISATSGLTIENSAEVISLAHLINGFSGAVVIKSNGEIVGDCVFKSVDETVDDFLPDRYHKGANTSIKTRSLLFLFGGSGRVSIFHNGYRILSHRGASWHLHSIELNRGIKLLCDEHSIDISVLQKILRIAYRMSDEGLGALITVGDHENVIKICDPPKTSHINWMPMNLNRISDEAIMGLMSQDGSTIISKDGSVVQTMIFLRPPAGTKGEEEVGRGSKHSTAAKVSCITDAICIAISVDGRITVYSRGKIAFKMMG